MASNKNLWAPWRMEYILADKEGKCFLCDAAKSENDRKSLVVARREKVFVLLNRYPYSNGHLLIAPYTHTGKIEDLSAEELGGMMALLAEMKEILDGLVGPHGYNVGMNVGRTAGAGVVDHLHMHIVPRWEGDTNFMPVTAETKVIPQHLDELWEKIAEAEK